MPPARSVSALSSQNENDFEKETGLRSTARCCGHRRHRQANSVRVCSPASRRVASLPPPLRGADGPDAGSAHARPDWLLLTMPTHTPLHVVVAVLSRMTRFPATVDSHAAGERGTGSRRQRSSVPLNKRQRAGKHNSFTSKRTVQSRFRAVLDPGRPKRAPSGCRHGHHHPAPRAPRRGDARLP